MGMYDNLECLAKLPLSERLQTLDVNWAGEVFQTKCLDNSLSSYKITEEGSLVEEVVEREYVHYTEEELKDTARPRWASIFKDIIIKDRFNRDVNYHGTVLFYTSVKYTKEEDIWVEFKAYFSHGKLDNIELAEEYTMVSAEKRIEEYNEEMRLRDLQPWNKFKKMLHPFGWRWFWLKTAKCCGSTANAIQKTQSLIYKHLL
jgi:hypothetical protein